MSQGRNILVMTYFSFRDGLIQAYTLPYLKIIHEVSPDRKIYLITKEKESMKLDDAEKEAALKDLSKFNIIWMTENYLPFGLRAMLSQTYLVWRLTKFIRSSDVGYIHCWGTPPGVEGFLLSKFSQARLILDSFEPHAEAQLENGTWTSQSLGYKVLSFFEKKMARAADTLIYTTRNMVEYARKRYDAYDEKEFIKPACVDLNLFSESYLNDPELTDQLGLRGNIVALYAGKFGGIYHDIEVFEFFKAASLHWKGKFKALLLTNSSHESIKEFSYKVGLEDGVVISRFVDHKDIPKYMGLADFAITPVRSVPTKRCCTPIKDGEYWAMSIPVIITRDISDDSDIIQKNGIGAILNDFSKEEIDSSIKEIDKLLLSNSRSDLYQKIRPIAEKYRNFDIAREIYSSIYS